MKKLMNKKGFTLMEMLIVVAIIVILVAVSIPTFTAQLDKAKSATDDANLRAAKAVALNIDMLGSWAEEVANYPDDDSAGVTLTYDINSGKFVFDEDEEIDPYGNGENTVITVVVTGGEITGDVDWAE